MNMNSNSIRRYLGLGLGVGIASFAIHQALHHQVPERFEPGVAEFRALSNLDSISESIANGETVLVQYNSDDSDDNQIVLPATDEITAGELKLAPAMGFDALDMSAEIGSETSVEESAATEIADGTREQVSINWNSETVDESADSVAMDDEVRLHELSGSNWRPNPFLNKDGGTESRLTQAIESKTVKSGSEIVQSDQIADSNEFSTDSHSFLQEVAPSHETTHVPMQMPVSQAVPLTPPVEPPIARTVEAPIAPTVVSKLEPSTSNLSQWEAVNPAKAMDQHPALPADLGLSESVLQRAAHHIEYGKALARRGSTYSARKQFYSALRVLAQSNDSVSGSTHYSASLREGILALKEAEDFAVNDAETRIGLNVSHVIETHQSDLITDEEAQYINTGAAMQRYFAFAAQQFEVATGNSAVAAEALYCLGKLHTTVARHEPSAGRLDLAKSIVYHRAALASDQNNHRSANELGVLLARSGQLHEAKNLLKKSLLINPTPQSWQNLTKVHLRLGEDDLARLAGSEYHRAMQQTPKGGIQWMPVRTFNASAPLGTREPLARQAKAVANPVPKAKDKVEKPKSIADRLKDLF